MKVLIIGGGIGGFATALSLHAVGIECEVFEQSRDIRELGVGINLLPHATRELAELGLLDALERAGIRTYELIYTNRFGQEIWHELRGHDDQVDVDWSATCTHRGAFLGYPPTGRRITVTGSSAFRLRDGKIVERHGRMDRLGLIRQLQGKAE